MDLGLVYKTWQNPKFWLWEAQDLMNAAELLLGREELLEEPYRQAVEQALRSMSVTNSKQVEVDTSRPNYFPGTLMGSYAIENLLKGLAIALTPAKANDADITRIKGHLSSRFIDRHGLLLPVEHRQTLDHLEIVVLWAGRYPVARTREQQKRVGFMSKQQLNELSLVIAMRALYRYLESDLLAHIPDTTRKPELIVLIDDSSFVSVVE